MKRKLSLAALIGFSFVICSCSSFAYLNSDDYLKAGIRITTNSEGFSNISAVSRWSTEFVPVLGDDQRRVVIVARHEQPLAGDLVLGASLRRRGGVG